MSKATQGFFIMLALLAIQAVARAVVDGTVDVPPDWAWVSSVAAAVLAALRGYMPTPK